MSQTRRLAAILAADVAGYSRLMGEDEEATHERLKAHLRELVDPKINKHRGRIVKNTGDGFLAEFASVVDAVRCAAEVQRCMAEREPGVPEEHRIMFRIGVNLGDVMVEEHDIFGDGVNIAARLEGLAVPGAICVSGTVRDHIGDRLPYVFEDIGEQTFKNIARPVRVYRVRIGAPVTVSAEALDATVKATLSLPEKPSVAVLPFANMSSDPEQEFFADGISEDIITALSRYPSLFVIARNSSFTYKGGAVNVKQVGRELGVRYVLEGSLRSAGNRIRVTAQLVEAETGKHVWAERYDLDAANIFAVQDEISEAVTIAIAPAIGRAELQRAVRTPPESLDAWTACQRGIWHLSKATVGDNALAEQFFMKAITLDPSFGGGYRGLATAYRESALFLTRNLSEALSSSEALARRAAQLDENDAEARRHVGSALLWRGDYEGAVAELERAVAMAPNLAAAHGILGAALIFSGRPKEGLATVETCMRLDPRSPFLFTYLLWVAIAYYLSQEYEAAIEAARDGIRSNPDFPLTYRWLAAALGQLDRIADAKEALENAVAIAPGSFDMFVRNRVPWMRPEDHAHMLEGLRKAGWREA
jgi:adenylate cyclase